MIKKLADHELDEFLVVAKKAVLAAESVIIKYYQMADEQNIEIKSDNTPVTLADKYAEKAIRACLHAHYPDHGIYGEEFGHNDSEQSDFLWLIDPIDGTKSFVRGYPFFSTQVALMYQGQLIVGVSNAPLTKELCHARLGGGAYLNGKRIYVNQSIEYYNSCLSSGNIQSLVKNNWHRFGQLLLKFGKTRGYGDFYHYHLLASGKVDLVVESDVNILDIAALVVIVREAGGVITDLAGMEINLETTSVLAGGQQSYNLGVKILNE